MVIFIIGGFGPAIAALVVTRLTGGSVRAWASRIVSWRAPSGFYLYALGLPALLYSAMNLELALLGENVDASLLFSRLPAYLLTLVFVAILGGGLEEPGWRGYALGRLQERHTPLRATLILGLLLGMWHVPIYGPAGFVVPLVLAFFYTYLFNKTGSILLCVLLHGSLTAAQDNLLLMAQEAHGITDAAIALTYVTAAALLLMLTRGRLGFDATSSNDQESLHPLEAQHHEGGSTVTKGGGSQDEN